MERHPKLKPRDALHAAVALACGATTIVSTDRDLDGIAGLRRQGLE
jgi:predicted nucleic acid-binding protein